MVDEEEEEELFTAQLPVSARDSAHSCAVSKFAYKANGHFRRMLRPQLFLLTKQSDSGSEKLAVKMGMYNKLGKIMNGKTPKNVVPGSLQQQRKEIDDPQDEDKYPFGLNDKIFMKVDDVKFKDIRSVHRVPPHLTEAVLGRQADKRERYRLPLPSTEKDVGVRKEKGYLVSVNDHLIALFKIEGQVYAIRDRCPHAGGPLSLGDIEELPRHGLCVKCPWHRFKFRLDTGAACEPEGRPETTLVYPVKVTSEGDIYVAFDALSEKFFSLDLHPGEGEVKKPRRVYYSKKSTNKDKDVSDF